jgi:hypothetical protein
MVFCSSKAHIYHPISLLASSRPDFFCTPNAVNDEILWQKILNFQIFSLYKDFLGQNNHFTLPFKEGVESNRENLHWFLYWGRYLNEIQTKSLEFSSLLFTVTFTALPWDFYFFKTHATSYSFYSSVTVHCKGERRKTCWKTITPSPIV